MAETILKAFERPDEIREFPLGRFEILHVAGVTFGRATYLSGHGVVAYDDGTQIDLLPGKAFHITTHPHDSWVVGDQSYVSLHVLKAS